MECAWKDMSAENECLVKVSHHDACARKVLGTNMECLVDAKQDLSQKREDERARKECQVELADSDGWDADTEQNSSEDSVDECVGEEMSDGDHRIGHADDYGNEDAELESAEELGIEPVGGDIGLDTEGLGDDSGLGRDTVYSADQVCNLMNSIRRHVKWTHEVAVSSMSREIVLNLLGSLRKEMKCAEKVVTKWILKHDCSQAAKLLKTSGDASSIKAVILQVGDQLEEFEDALQLNELQQDEDELEEFEGALWQDEDELERFDGASRQDEDELKEFESQQDEDELKEFESQQDEDELEEFEGASRQDEDELEEFEGASRPAEDELQEFGECESEDEYIGGDEELGTEGVSGDDDSELEDGSEEEIESGSEVESEEEVSGEGGEGGDSDEESEDEGQSEDSGEEESEEKEDGSEEEDVSEQDEDESSEDNEGEDDDKDSESEELMEDDSVSDAAEDSRGSEEEISDELQPPKKKKARMSGTTVFVGNLPFTATEEDLATFFTSKRHPSQSVRVLTSRGRSRGFGYAEFDSVKKAEAALKLSGKKFQGRALTIAMATEKQKPEQGQKVSSRSEKGRGSDKRGEHGAQNGGSEKPANKLFVKNLCYDTTVSTLQELFPEATSIFLPEDKETGQKRGFGFLTFADVANAETALNEFDGHEVDGFEIKLTYARERQKTAAGKARGPDTPGRGKRRSGRGGGGRSGMEEKRTNKLFIKNLCHDTEVSTLKELFPEASQVSLPKDKATGERKGYGFVTFPDEASAESVKTSFDGHEVDSFKISISFAQDRPRGRTQGGHRGGSGRIRGSGHGRGSERGRGRGGGRRGGERSGRGRGSGRGSKSRSEPRSSKVKGSIQAFQGTKLKFGGDSD